MKRNLNGIAIASAFTALAISAVSLWWLQMTKADLESEIAGLKESVKIQATRSIADDSTTAARDSAIAGLETRMDIMHATLDGVAVRTGYYPQPMPFDPETAVEGQRYGSLTLTSLTLGPAVGDSPQKNFDARFSGTVKLSGRYMTTTAQDMFPDHVFFTPDAKSCGLLPFGWPGSNEDCPVRLNFGSDVATRKMLPGAGTATVVLTDYRIAFFEGTEGTGPAVTLLQATQVRQDQVE